MIQTFKINFIAGLCSQDKTSHLQLWDRLLQQAKISLNFIKQPRTLPNISAYIHIFREFDFNRIHLASPGTRIVIHNGPNDRASWAPYGEDSCYIGPEIELYRCHKVYIPKTREERISDTVEPPPPQKK